ncbi:unnamed protein product [Pleuronectes platessa]|uniref:Uncharacterized protein n=1 Tax=Pleuronectes platessa TaxID=8262 RepID=A0A9N7Z4C4_PLEPL|nr:unnamed protein product [Pleuronectes platessa]
MLSGSIVREFQRLCDDVTGAFQGPLRVERTARRDCGFLTPDWWLYERSSVWSQARLVEEVKAEVVKWILLSRSHQGKGRKRRRIEPKVNYKEVGGTLLYLGRYLPSFCFYSESWP